MGSAESAHNRFATSSSVHRDISRNSRRRLPDAGARSTVAPSCTDQWSQCASCLQICLTYRRINVRADVVSFDRHVEVDGGSEMTWSGSEERSSRLRMETEWPECADLDVRTLPDGRLP